MRAAVAAGRKFRLSTVQAQTLAFEALGGCLMVEA